MNAISKTILNDYGYYSCISDLINSDVVKQMDNYVQHGSTSTLDHCIRVSYRAYKISKKLHMDYLSAARGALLHDLFLYDWHLRPKGDKLFQKHGFTHPQTAYENASKHFNLSKKEKDIIVKHMWPLTLRKVPRYKESMLVSLIDKYSSVGETLVPAFAKISDYLL